MRGRGYRRFRKNRGALIGFGLVVFVIATAFLGPFFTPHDPEQQNRETLLHDDGSPVEPWTVDGHILGGDDKGRDLLSRLLKGGTISMEVALAATSIAVFLGIFVGVLSGYFRGPVDAVSMRVVDIILSLPFLLVAIAIQRVIKDPSLLTLILLLGCLSWTSLARVTRAKTLQVRELEFIDAARALGMSHFRIVFRHVLPNVLGPAIVIGTTLVAQVIIIESAMSYLGIGAQEASWGRMLRDGQEMLSHAPRLVFLPGLLIMAAVFGFNLLGEGLRDALDPKD
ncbi:MAG: ABC transporter permease [Myxococcota bacterium]